MASPSPHAPAAVPASLTRVARGLTAEFAADIDEPVVLAYVSKAAAAVAFFGDDPAERADWVARIARNELTLLAGRDTDRARM